MLTQIKFYMILRIVIFLATFTPSYSYTVTASSIRDLTDDNTNFELETLSWIPFNNKTATLYDRCGSLYYIGGHNVSYLQSSFTRTYAGLPSHNNIYFTLYFVIIDDWATTDTAVIEFDSYPVTFLYNYSKATYSTSTICGGPQKDRTGTRIRGKIPHIGSTLNVTISSNSSTGAVAFRNLTLSFRNQLPEETQPTCVISLFGYRRVNTCGNCPEGQYRAPTTGNCYNCHANCLTCYGTGPTDCGIYQPGIIPVGIRCAPYYSPCSNCTINEKEYFSYRDHSWLGTCSPPLMADLYGFIRSCTQDCQSDQCLNPNGTCGTQCESPLFPIVRYNMTFCEYRCSFGYIMHTNLSCLTDCGYPLVVRATANGKICEYPCASNEIVSYYNVCVPACPYPFHNTTNAYDRYCEYACNVTAGEVRFYNNTCDQLTKCTAPLVLKDTAPPYKTCESSCLMSEFIYWNTSCKSTCPDPFTTRLQFGLKFCDPPMCGSTPCQSCKSTSECPENYNCNTFIGGYCIIKIAYFKAGLVMTITNGYVLVAEVTPKVDLQEAVDDILLVGVGGLVLMQDYQVLIEKISLAKFKVTILLLRSVSSESLVANLQYSPFRLDYRTEVLLPRMVYISEETVKTSQKVGTATDTSFILLIVSIVAFVVLGKISNVFSFICINQYLHGLLYLNVNYLQHVKFYLKSLKNYNAIFSSDEIAETNIDSVITRKMSLPSRFFEEEFPISFIWNSMQIFGTVLGTLSILGIVFFFLKTLRTPPKLLRKLRSILKWNLLIRQILTYSLSLVTAAFIQIHASIFGRQKNILPLLGAFLCLVSFMAIFAKMFGVITYIPQTIQSRVAYTGRYGSLWQGLNLNGSYRYYYWLSFLRGLLLVYVCVFMELYPIAQLLILMTYQVGMISLFLRGASVQPVMLDKSLNFVSLLLEILLLLTKGAILCSWAMSERLVSDQILLITGWTIVGFGVLIQISQAIYSMYMQVTNWKKIWAEIKGLWRSILRKPKRKKIKRLKVERIFEDGVQ